MYRQTCASSPGFLQPVLICTVSVRAWTSPGLEAAESRWWELLGTLSWRILSGCLQKMGKSPMSSKHKFLTGCSSVFWSSNRCVLLSCYLQSFVLAFLLFPPGSFFWADSQQSIPSPHLPFCSPLLSAWCFSISLTSISVLINNSL